MPDFAWYNIPKLGKIRTYTKGPQNIPKRHKYQIIVKYSKWPTQFPLEGHSKCTQIYIFGLKMYHLATLISATDLAVYVCMQNNREHIASLITYNLAAS
jgi:hypothetical protein